MKPALKALKWLVVILGFWDIAIRFGLICPNIDPPLGYTIVHQERLGWGYSTKQLEMILISRQGGWTRHGAVSDAWIDQMKRTPFKRWGEGWRWNLHKLWYCVAVPISAVTPLRRPSE